MLDRTAALCGFWRPAPFCRAVLDVVVVETELADGHGARGRLDLVQERQRALLADGRDVRGRREVDARQVARHRDRPQDLLRRRRRARARLGRAHRRPPFTPCRGRGRGRTAPCRAPRCTSSTTSSTPRDGTCGAKGAGREARGGGCARRGGVCGGRGGTGLRDEVHAALDEGVGEDVGRGRARGGLDAEEGVYHVLHVVAVADHGRVAAAQDLLRELLRARRVERVPQHAHLVQHAPQRPHVALAVVRLLAPDLGADVERRPNHRLRERRLEHLRHTEIPDLRHNRRVRQKHVRRLQILRNTSCAQKEMRKNGKKDGKEAI